MTPNTLRRRLAAAFAAVVVAGAGIGWGVGKASADELTYLQLLNLHNIHVYDTALAVRTGWNICDQLNYTTGDVVAANLYATSSWRDVPTPSVAAAWVVASVRGLCPWHDHTGVVS